MIYCSLIDTYMTIRDALRDAVRGLRNSAIVINADADTAYQLIANTMGAARHLSLKNITHSSTDDARRGWAIKFARLNDRISDLS